MKPDISRKGLAVVTGASSGIGYELARCAVQDGYDLIVVADEAEIESAAARLRAAGTEVEAVQADLSTQAGVEKLLSRITANGRPVDLLFANAGQGLGDGFLDQVRFIGRQRPFQEAEAIGGSPSEIDIHRIDRAGNASARETDDIRFSRPICANIPCRAPKKWFRNRHCSKLSTK